MSLEKRCPDKGDLSLAEVNTHLDALNSATDRKEKEKILQSMLRRTTALEQKWIVRIILKGLLSHPSSPPQRSYRLTIYPELKMGSSEKTILTHFHPDAVELFNVTSNLRRVCEELKGDANIRLNPQGAGLFQPVKPMLASRAYPEGVMKIMGDRPFTVETKFDGERYAA